MTLEKPSGFIHNTAQKIKDIPHNIRSKNKVMTELGISALSLVLFPIGPAIIGTLNMVNAGIEAFDVKHSKKGASMTRAGLYAGAGIFEYGLEFAGVQKIGTLEADFIREHLGSVVPDFAHPILGLLSSSAIGLFTGLFTNTALWEARRQRE